VKGVAGSWPVIAIYTATQILTNTAKILAHTHTWQHIDNYVCVPDLMAIAGQARNQIKANSKQINTNTKEDPHTQILTNT